MANNEDSFASLQEDVENAASIQEQVDSVAALQEEIDRLSDLSGEEVDLKLDSRLAAALLLERSLSQKRELQSSRILRFRDELEYIPSPLGQRAWNQAEIKTPPRSDDEDEDEDDTAIENDLETALGGLTISRSPPPYSSVSKSRRLAMDLGIVRPPTGFGHRPSNHAGLSAPPGFGFPASMSPPPRTDLAPGIGPPPHYGQLSPASAALLADLSFGSLRARRDEEDGGGGGGGGGRGMPRSLLELTLDSQPDEDDDDDDRGRCPIGLGIIGSERRKRPQRQRCFSLLQDESEDEDASGGARL